MHAFRSSTLGWALERAQNERRRERESQMAEQEAAAVTAAAVTATATATASESEARAEGERGEGSSSGPPAPSVVEYDPVTGVPSEFNEFLPPECIEYKKWVAAQEGPEALEKLTLKDEEGNEIEKMLPGGKVKKKKKPEVVIEASTRNRKKSLTTVTGLDAFGIKLADAAKMFGKKFASGCSVSKSASGGEHVDVQGDVVHELPDFLVKKFAAKGLKKESIYVVVGKKKRRYFDVEDEEDEDEDEF